MLLQNTDHKIFYCLLHFLTGVEMATAASIRTSRKYVKAKCECYMQSFVPEYSLYIVFVL